MNPVHHLLHESHDLMCECKKMDEIYQPDLLGPGIYYQTQEARGRPTMQDGYSIS